MGLIIILIRLNKSKLLVQIIFIDFYIFLYDYFHIIKNKDKYTFFSWTICFNTLNNYALYSTRPHKNYNSVRGVK